MVQADAAMHPDEHHENTLTSRLGRPHRPQRINIIVVDAINLMHDARADDVTQQEQGNEEPEGELHPLVRPDPQSAALQKAPDAEDKMSYRRREQYDRPGSATGYSGANIAHALHKVDGDEAGGVIEEMGRGEGEEDEARSEPQLSGGWLPADDRDVSSDLEDGGHRSFGRLNVSDGA